MDIRKWAKGIAVAAILLLAVAGAMQPAEASHSQGYPCYQCHTLRPGEARTGSRAIRQDQPVLATIPPAGTVWTGGMPVSCDFCHRSATDIPTLNMATKAKKHPVDLIQTGNLNPANEITCNDCHDNATQDVVPLSLTAQNGSDGYPDHKGVDNVYAHNLTNNPPHVSAAWPYWGATLPGLVRANDTAFWTNVQSGTQAILCWRCHDGTNTAPYTTGVRSSKVVKNDYVDGVTTTAKGHKIQTSVAGALGVGSALPCYNCHDSHGSTNNALILDANSIYSDNTSLLAVTTYNQGARPYNDLVVCAGCHDTNNATTLATKAGGVANVVEGMYPVDPYDSTGTGAMHIASGIAAVMTSSTKTCLSANGGCHANPHNPVGESKGGQSCALCHNTLYQAMNAGTATGYHHVMLGDNAPVGGVYPTNATPAGTTTDRTCLICHVDHNYFSKLISPALTRAKNLRNDITVQPDNATNAPLRTDYDNTLTRGGICTSCHQNAQTKRNPGTDIKNDGVATVPLVSKALYGGSAHNYPSISPFIQGHFSSDNADASAYFQANCSKCHNDTTGTSFQDGAYRFGLHASDGANAVNNLLAPMGYTPLTDNLAANFCYRCHSHGSQLSNGKTVDAKDYYNNANMDNASESTYNVFGRTSRHPLALVDCLSCHNVHATRSATGGIVANPDNTYAFDAYVLSDNTQTGKANRAGFCLKCHDANGLTQTVSAGTYIPKTIAAASTVMNKSTNAARGHWSVSGSLQATTTQACDACHDKHGSTARALLGQFDAATGVNRINGVAVSATVTAADNAAVCGACHAAAGLGYSAQANPTVGAGGSIMVFEGYRLAASAVNPGDNGYFSATPSGSVTTPRWPGMTVWNASAHNTAAKNGPAALGGRPIADCNGCHDPHGSPNKFNMLTDNMAAGNYRLCFDCHDGVVGTADIKRFFPVAVGGTWATSDNTHGHKIRTAGGRLAVGTSLPCYDCHMTHGSRNNNAYMLSDQRWNNLGDTLSTPSAARILCLGCHSTSDATPRDGYGNTVTAADTIEGLNRIAARPLRLPATVPAHLYAGTDSCYTCHGSSYADNTANNVHNPSLGEGGPDVGQYFDRKIQAPSGTNYADNSSHPLRGLTDNTAALLFGASGSTNCLACHYSGSARTSDECLKCHFENTSGANGALGPQHMDKQLQLATVSGNSLPSSAYTITTIAQYDAWCLQCHNTGATTSLGGITPSAANKTVKTAAAFTNGRHRANNVGCIYCHQPHGRNNAKLVREDGYNRSLLAPTPSRFNVFPSDNIVSSSGAPLRAQSANYRARPYWADNVANPYLGEASDDQAYCNTMCHVGRFSASYVKDKIVKRDATSGFYVTGSAPQYRKIFVINGIEYTIDNNLVTTYHAHVNGEIIPTDNMISAYASMIGSTGPSYYQYPMATGSLPSAYVPANSDLPFLPDYVDAVRDFTNAYNNLGQRIAYRFTCSTCHDPHGTTLPNLAGNDGFPDLRLPRANPSTLCVRCHK